MMRYYADIDALITPPPLSLMPCRVHTPLMLALHAAGYMI